MKWKRKSREKKGSEFFSLLHVRFIDFRCPNKIVFNGLFSSLSLVFSSLLLRGQYAEMFTTSLSKKKYSWGLHTKSSPFFSFFQKVLLRTIYQCAIIVMGVFSGLRIFVMDIKTIEWFRIFLWNQWCFLYTFFCKCEVVEMEILFLFFGYGKKWIHFDVEFLFAFCGLERLIFYVNVNDNPLIF